MSHLKTSETPIEGVLVVQRQRRGDSRGYLERIFDTEELTSILGSRSIDQVNRTVTQSAGTVRGLHLQLPPNAEMKIVTCLRGAVLDVAVDLRARSSTFGKWFATELNEGNGAALLIPEGCAHGLQTLTTDCEMLYLHTARYAPESESGLDPRTVELAIPWPLPISTISDRDASERAELNYFRGVNW